MHFIEIYVNELFFTEDALDCEQNSEVVVRIHIHCSCFSPQLHTSELQDGYDWGRLNLQSVTEQSNLDDFLATAEMAGTEFTAGKKFQ